MRTLRACLPDEDNLDVERTKSERVLLRPGARTNPLYRLSHLRYNLS